MNLLNQLSDQSKIILVLYNEITRIIDTIDELNEVIPTGKTNFIQMIDELKKIKKEDNRDQY